MKGMSSLYRFVAECESSLHSFREKETKTLDRIDVVKTKLQTATQAIQHDDERINSLGAEISGVLLRGSILMR